MANHAGGGTTDPYWENFPVHGLLPPDGHQKLFLNSNGLDLTKKSLKIRLYSWGDNSENAISLPYSLENNGELASVIISVEKFGPYWLEVDLPENSSIRTVLSKRLLHLPPARSLSKEERWESMIGVNSHQWANWALFQRMGIHWVRDYTWGWYGTGAEGVITSQNEDFSERLAQATLHEINVLPCIQKTFVTEDKSRWMDDAEDIQRIFNRISSHFPNQKIFQIGNEEESLFPGHIHEPDNYAQFIYNAARGLEQADNDAVILLAGDVFMYEEVMEEILQSQANESFLGSAIHIYTGTVSPEIATRDTNVGSEERRVDTLVLDRVRAYCQMFQKEDKEVWVTETGWDVIYGPAVGERRQAIYLPRMYLLLRAAGASKIFWFFDRDGTAGVRFSSSGLKDPNLMLRPSAATLAAVSHLASNITPAGTLDLGHPDIYTYVWKTGDQRWLITTWSVEEEHGLPDLFKSATEAYDVFANPIDTKDRVISDEVTYFYFDNLPKWVNEQRQAHLLSNRLHSARIGEPLTITVDTGSSHAVADLKTISSDLELIDKSKNETVVTYMVQVSPKAEIGIHGLSLVVSGEQWEKKWPIRVNALPALERVGPPVGGDQPSTHFLIRADGQSMKGEIMVLEGGGEVSPSLFSAQGGQKLEFRYYPGDNLYQPVPLRIILNDGIEQTITLQPETIPVPDLSSLDTDFSSLDIFQMDNSYFVLSRDGLDFAMSIAWSEDSLHLWAKIPADEAFSADPEWFWNYQNLEIILSPGKTDDNTNGDIRQFFFTPIFDQGEWRLLSGIWGGRNQPPKANIFDHPEIFTEIRIEEEKNALFFEAKIPFEIIGAAPQRGDTWRAAVAMQSGKPSQMDLQAAWPRSKNAGFLNDSAYWGKLRFK